jgi:hypothetical protein
LLTDTEVTNYEALEAELGKAQKDEGVRTRNAAYNAVVNPGLAPSTPARSAVVGAMGLLYTPVGLNPRPGASPRTSSTRSASADRHSHARTH